MKFQEITGDLIELAKEGKFDVIAHGCNCFCTMKSGIAPQMAKTFGCDKFDLEKHGHKGNIDKLGRIDYDYIELTHLKEFRELCIINCYTQYEYGTDKTYLDYEALKLCMRKINRLFSGLHIGLPLIGCGKAGGIWDDSKLSILELRRLPLGFKDVRTIIEEELVNMDITIVHYEK